MAFASRTARRLQNEVDRTNILAPGVCSDPGRNHLLPAFTVLLWRPRMLSGHNQRAAGGTPATTTIGPLGSRIQLQQRNCSRFSRDFLRRSTFSSSQRTGLRSSGLRSALQELFNQPSNNRFLCYQLTLALTSLSPAAPVSSARISPWRCRKDSKTHV